MLIAHFSDLHILRPRPGRDLGKRADAAERLDRCVGVVNALTPRPDVAIVTGDLCHDGDAGDYALLAEIMRPLAMPFFLVPGNHDRRALLVEAFADTGANGSRTGPGPAPVAQAGEFLQFAVEGYPLRLLFLDTLDPGRQGGRLCGERLAWLETALAEQPDRPTVIALHHPPVPTALACFDAEPLIGGDELAAIVRRHPSVVRLLCGHLHRPLHAGFAGTVVSTAPSTAFQVAPDLGPNRPLRLADEPGGVLLHAWQPDSRPGAGEAGVGWGMATHIVLL